MRDDMSGWMQLTAGQQKAARAAATLIEDEGMQFLLLLFGEQERGAIIGNIEPTQSIKLIEAAHTAASAMAAGEARIEDIETTLQ